jgi:hypothetical protein
MIENELEEFLYRGESESLDFKREQYRFVKATDPDKAKLLKDVLAFANSWREEPAHIFIGVEEASGQKATVVGILASDHLADAAVQQFVNTKTNRPVRFSYEKVEYHGKHVGVIRFAHPQERPVYLKTRFARLKRGVVYIRRGSSVDEASPDELAAMGRAEAREADTPQVEMEFALPAQHRRLGLEVELRSIHFKLPPRPDAPPRQAGYDLGVQLAEVLGQGVKTDAERRWDELAEAASKARLIPIGLWLRNGGSAPAHDVRVVFEFPETPGLAFIEEHELEPTGYLHVAHIPTRWDFSVQRLNRGWELEIAVGKIQPKDEQFTRATLYIDAERTLEASGTARVFADNLPDPVLVPVVLRIAVEVRDTSLVDFERQFGTGSE